jgi:hypothetical protein
LRNEVPCYSSKFIMANWAFIELLLIYFSKYSIVLCSFFLCKSTLLCSPSIMVFNYVYGSISSLFAASKWGYYSAFNPGVEWRFGLPQTGAGHGKWLIWYYILVRNHLRKMVSTRIFIFFLSNHLSNRYKICTGK